MMRIINIIILSLFLNFGSSGSKLWFELTQNYISYGDYVATGEGVDADKKYASLLADANEFNLDERAAADMTSDELLLQIQDDDQIELAQAKLVTISIGINDIVNAIMPYVLECYDITTFSMDVNALIEQFENPDVRSQIQTAVDNFEDNYSQIIDIVSQTNRNVYVINLYNPFSSIVVYDTSANLGRINLGLYAEEWIDKINNIIADQDKVKVVDINSSFEVNNDDTKLVNAEFNLNDFSFNYNSYLTEAGQEVIYNELDTAIYHTPDVIEPIDNEYSAILIYVFILGGLAFIGLILGDIQLLLIGKAPKKKI